MPVINVTKGDILASSTIQEVGYYSMVVSKIDLETSKNGDSTNIIVNCEVIDDPKWEGKQIRTYFNSKGIGNILPLYAATTGVKLDGAGALNTDDMVGKKFDGKIGTRPYEGRLVNEIQDYLPYGAGKSAGASPWS